MKTFGLVMSVIVFVMWSAGMMAVLYSPGLAFMLWSVPAGWGAGSAIAELWGTYEKR